MLVCYVAGARMQFLTYPDFMYAFINVESDHFEKVCFPRWGMDKCISYQQIIVDGQTNHCFKVNFPYPSGPFYPPKVRMLMFPDSWFQPFYNVTGVSGNSN